VRQPRARRDRGFSLLVVFMLIIVMVGAAATVMLSTQQDLSVAGQDRESLQSFYAAEYAVAQAKDYLAALSSTFWNAGTGWTPLLASGVPQLCVPTGVSPPTAPGIVPAATNPWNDFRDAQQNTLFVNGAVSGAAKVQWRYCVHNDAEDLAYLDTAANSAGQTGDNSDARDAQHQLVIEGYGQVIPVGPANPTALAAARVWVIIQGPSGAPVTPANCYTQEGGCGSHGDNGGVQEQNIGVIANSGPTSVRGL
jgi:Tfp pilus assembly protein PilX